jgi:hypothetical protein
MTVYRRQRAHIVPGRPRTPRLKKKDTAMQMIVARMKCGKTEYEARLPLPAGGTKDPAALRSLKLQLKLMLAEQIVKGSKVTYTRETLVGGSLR